MKPMSGHQSLVVNLAQLGAPKVPLATHSMQLEMEFLLQGRMSCSASGVHSYSLEPTFSKNHS